MTEGTPPRDAIRQRTGTVPAVCVLLLTAMLSLGWSHVRLLWNDEFLSFYGDSTASLRTVWNVQLHSPISLDPPTYHLLSHLSMDVIGRNAIALRLPALAGFLLLQLCLFLLVRRLAGARAGLVAMTFPLLTASFRYSVEGRPYGLLLGLYALSLFCWYAAAADEVRPRLPALVGLTAAIALAITSHYFGVLILVPVSLGEFARTVKRRRFDWPMVAALAAGLASVGLILPFQKALLPYRQHYYTSTVNLHNVSQGYRELFLRYNSFSIPAQRVMALLLVVATLTLVFAALRNFRQGPAPAHILAANSNTVAGDAAETDGTPFAQATVGRVTGQHAALENIAGSTTANDRALWIALWVALLAFAGLPFVGYLFGKFVTHTLEVRYVIAALIFFAVALALVLERRLRSDRFFYGVFASMLLVATVAAAAQIRTERRNGEAILAGLTVPPALAAELAAHPAERLYTQSLTDLFTISYYAPMPLVRDRITLLYDEEAEVHWLGHNTNAVTAVYLQRFSGLHTETYARFLAQPAPLLLEYNTGWEWIGQDLRARHATRQPLGSALHGNLVRVTTP